MSTQSTVAIEKMVFRKTNAQTGRHLAVTPENSTMRHLTYGRIRLNSVTPSVSFATGERETGLICLSGHARIKTSGKEFALGQYDSAYIPRDSCVEVCGRGQGSRHEIYGKGPWLQARIEHAYR